MTDKNHIPDVAQGAVTSGLSPRQRASKILFGDIHWVDREDMADLMDDEFVQDDGSNQRRISPNALIAELEAGLGGRYPSGCGQAVIESWRDGGLSPDATRYVDAIRSARRELKAHISALDPADDLRLFLRDILRGLDSALAAQPPAAPVERYYCPTCCGDGKYDSRMCGLPPEADTTCVDCKGTGIEPAAPVETCKTCNGRREVGGFDRGDNAYRTEPCPECSPQRSSADTTNRSVTWRQSDEAIRNMIAREIWRYQECEEAYGPFDDNADEAKQLDIGMRSLIKQTAIDQAELIRAVVLASPVVKAAIARLITEDDVYEIGKRDGYEDAVQTIDVATGGDGEFRGSTDPDRVVDVPAMQARIIDRLRPVPQPSAGTALPWWKILADNWRGRNGNTVTGDSVRNSCADELEKVAARTVWQDGQTCPTCGRIGNGEG